MQSTKGMMKMYSLLDSVYEPSNPYVCTHAEVLIPLLRFKQDDSAVLIKGNRVSFDRFSCINILKKQMVNHTLIEEFFFQDSAVLSILIKAYNFIDKDVRSS